MNLSFLQRIQCFSKTALCLYFTLSFSFQMLSLCSEKVDPDRPPNSPFHLALLVMCCQPQQKSGGKQPETNTSLPLQGMLCFLKKGQRRHAAGAHGQRQTPKTKICQKESKRKQNKGVCHFHQRRLFLVKLIQLVSLFNVRRCCLLMWDTCFF